MSTVVSTLQPDLTATILDIRLLNELVQPQTENSKILMDDNRVLWAIYMASSELRAGIYRTYAGDGYLTADSPYSSMAITPKENEHSGISENSGSGVLYGIIPASTAETEMWKITFSSSTAFSVVGSRSGSQGSGTTSATFTSTNSYISIPSDVWSGTPAASDVFYISTYKHYPLVIYLTSLIAASIIHNGLFNFLAPNESIITDRFRQEANRLIKALNNGYDFAGQPFRLPSFSIDDMAEIPNPFHINRLGADDSNYSSTEEPNIRSTEQYYDGYPFWWR